MGMPIGYCITCGHGPESHAGAIPHVRDRDACAVCDCGRYKPKMQSSRRPALKVKPCCSDQYVGTNNVCANCGQDIGAVVANADLTG